MPGEPLTAECDGVDVLERQYAMLARRLDREGEVVVGRCCSWAVYATTQACQVAHAAEC